MASQLSFAVSDINSDDEYISIINSIREDFLKAKISAKSALCSATTLRSKSDTASERIADETKHAEIKVAYEATSDADCDAAIFAATNKYDTTIAAMRASTDTALEDINATYEAACLAAGNIAYNSIGEATSNPKLKKSDPSKRFDLFSFLFEGGMACYSP
jgi:hypothetical protein